MTSDEPVFYSTRRFYPYQGTAQIVQWQDFMAMSVDGLSWKVRLNQEGTRYSAYGTWCPDRQGSFIETRHTAPFIEVLESRPALPFVAGDKMELWMLDAQEVLPLALITTTLPRTDPPKLQELSWEASLRPDDTFVAPSLLNGCTGLDTDDALISHSEVFQRCIRVAVGNQPRAQWFLRDQTGNAIGFDGCLVGPELHGRRLDNEKFPELLISELVWENDQERELVKDFHHWHASDLLTHTNLTDETRDRLERVACKSALSLFARRHVLPRVINKELIDQALVEAKIRYSSGSTNKTS